MRIFGKTGTTDRMRTRLPRVATFALFCFLSCTTHIHAPCRGAEPSGDGQPASPASPVAGQAEAEADALLGRAVVALENCHSIAAGLSCQVDLFGKQWGGGGDYWEERSGPFPKVRMELKIPLGDKTGAMVQICDGRFLWTYRRLIDDEKLERVDLARVAAVLGRRAVAASDSPIIGTIGAGGLGGLLRELQRDFRFGIDRQTELLGVPVTILRGHWLPERLATVLPDQKDAILRGGKPNYRKLPRHLPTSVVVMLGARDLFPYRIEYRRDDAQRASGWDEGASDSVRTMVSMQLEPRNEAVGPAHFECKPGGIDVADVTEAFIKRAQARRDSANASSAGPQVGEGPGARASRP
jgi:hypothetical protein